MAVKDGDSIEVRHNGEIERIRLYGIDTPEYRQPYSREAKRRSTQLLHGRTARITVMDKDKYGRTVAMVESGGSLINEILVREGLAWVHVWFCHRKPECVKWKRLEREAREGKRGLWRGKDPEPPWEWKKRNRKR